MYRLVRMLLLSVLVPLLLLPGACSMTAAGAADAGAQVTALADRYIGALLEAYPEFGTQLGMPGAAHDRLSDISPESLARFHAVEDSILAALEALPAGALVEGSPEEVTYGFLRDVLRNARGFRVCRMELWNVSPTYTGWQSVLAQLADVQPIGTPAQNEAALRRFGELPRYLDQEIANLRRGLGLGYSSPRGNVRGVVRQLEALLAAPVAQSPFVAMAPDTLPVFRAALERLEMESIRPAIARYRAFLVDEYLPAARAAIAVAANPDGESCYRAAVRYHATVDMSPDDVQRTGLEQMARIRGEMQQIAERSFGTRAVGSVLERLRTDRRYLISSREEMMRIARDAVSRGAAAAPQWFGRVPAATVVVEPVPAFQEAAAPSGFYVNPAEDGERPGTYYINLHDAANQPRAGLEATAFHETYPGHHLQIAIAMERTDLHPVQRYLYLSGFGEGWALYTERLAEEMGLYSGDVDRLGLLSNEALRAARLVVDAGMHALGWSREQAVDYMLQNTAESRSSVESEVDRYIAVPGQATAYLLGALEIRSLRAEAETRLGAAFDVRAFHDRVLEDGAMPLSMLRRKIERWLRSGS
jgi:uncharacterized protein (DUF885 family)